MIGVSSVRIELSSDGGVTFPTKLVDSLPVGYWVWAVPASQPEGKLYRIRVTDVSNPAVSDMSHGNFSIGTWVGITKQPESARRCVGQSVTFTVVAGRNISGYLWRKGTVDVGNGSSSFTIPSVSYSDSGSYNVVVLDNCMHAQVSREVTLTVNDPPVININPLPEIFRCANDSLSLIVLSTGDTLGYQWRHNGNNIPGATDTRYLIPALTAGDTGYYDVVVSGGCQQRVTSRLSRVRLLPALQSVSPSDTVIIAKVGTLLTFEIISSPDTTVLPYHMLQYQWRKNGDTVPTVWPYLPSSNHFVFDRVHHRDSGIYTCRVNSACGDTQYVKFTLKTTGVEPDPGVGVATYDNRTGISDISIVPNPTIRAASIRFTLSDAAPDVFIFVCDADGRIVKRLNTFGHRGQVVLQWDGAGDDGKSCPAGVYRVVLRLGWWQQTFPLCLLH